MSKKPNQSSHDFYEFKCVCVCVCTYACIYFSFSFLNCIGVFSTSKLVTHNFVATMTPSSKKSISVPRVSLETQLSLEKLK